MSLTIRRKLALTGALAALLLVSASAAGIFSQVTSNHGLQAVTKVTGAVRAQMQADMMHDALRADVLMAIKVGAAGSTDEKGQVRADLTEHSENFNAAIAELDQVSDADVKAAVEAVKPDLAAYIASADDLLKAADTGNAEAKYPEFQAAFENLEERMETLGDLIEKTGSAIAADAESSNQLLFWVLIGVSTVAILLILVLNWLNANSVSKPILAMTDAMKKLAAGDLHAAIPARERKDEIGTMSAAVQVFKENAITATELAAKQKAADAERAKRSQRLEELCREFSNGVSVDLANVLTQVTGIEKGAAQMAGRAGETANEATHAGDASQSAAANVNSVAAASEELASSIAEIGRQMARSVAVANTAASDATTASKDIAALANSAQQIGAVVNLIGKITQQTKLLALNATIEAARAGAAGKGFAVVAGEVKKLSEETALAAEQITAQVGTIQSGASGAVGSIERIGTVIGEIREITAAVAAAVEEQGAATHEIARNVDQAAQSAATVDGAIAQVRTTADDTGTLAGKMADASVALTMGSNTLKKKIDGFLADVRSI